ncbi:MAG: hypothetical protein IPJ33_20715 [Gammaproteobacteria bacterium]|nr:hypothetical protein [Gammaproteobacteria bacterium]
MNITYDGWLVVVTQHGYVVSIKRDFTDYRVLRILHSDGVEEKGTAPTLDGWIRNGHAIDQEGGIYIVAQQNMHKVIWTGDRLSTAEADGAWTASYLNGSGRGSGATPSLMGFGKEDQFVVITDGEPLMNLTLFWRNEIPEDWKQLAHAPSRRVAGMKAVNMGDPNLKAIQSEQSVVVAGYGALVVNNIPRNKPWYLPKEAGFLLTTFLGSSPRYQPFGAQKFEWDPKTRKLENAWVNSEVSSPNCLPLVSHGSDTAYLIGARNNQWVLEALNWQTGESRFHYVIGNQRYNSLFGGTLLDERGRINFGTTWGRARLDPQ